LLALGHWQLVLCGFVNLGFKGLLTAVANRIPPHKSIEHVTGKKQFFFRVAESTTYCFDRS
jgi:hypothetical protein